MVDRSTAPLEMFGEPDDTECPHGIPTGMGVECWECRYDQLKIDYDALEQECGELAERVQELAAEIAEPSIRERDELREMVAMAQRYEARKDYFGNVILPPKNDEGELVLYSDYAALEQRFNALSTKFSALVEENATLERERDELLRAEHKLSDAYIRIRRKLNAFDTPYAPTPEQIYELTEKKLDELQAENAMLRKRLEPIECAWSTKSNYLVEEFIDVMYEAIEKAMELKEGE